MERINHDPAVADDLHRYNNLKKHLADCARDNIKPDWFVQVIVDQFERIAALTKEVEGLKNELIIREKRITAVAENYERELTRMTESRDRWRKEAELAVAKLEGNQ